MARIRTIKPDFFVDEKVSRLKRDARLLFLGLLVYSDDYGTVRSNPVLIKSNIFPYDEALRTSDVKSWLDALVSLGMLEPFEYNGECFFNIRTFNIHQKVDHKSKPIVPIDKKEIILNQLYKGNSETLAKSSRDNRESLAPEVGSSTEEVGSSSGNGNGIDPPTLTAQQKKILLEQEYSELTESLTGKAAKDWWIPIKDFIKQKRPDFILPYADAWNLFATKFKLNKTKITKERVDNFKKRICESQFDFIDILEKVKGSSFALGDNDRNWKVDFAFILESEENYIKILEGKYV